MAAYETTAATALPVWPKKSFLYSDRRMSMQKESSMSGQPSTPSAASTSASASGMVDDVDLPLIDYKLSQLATKVKWMVRGHGNDRS